MPPASTTIPLGEMPGDREPVHGIAGAIEGVLREPRRLLFQLRENRGSGLSLRLLLAALGCALLYGLVMGSFSMGEQLWAAPLKVAGGFLLSLLICLPSLYIFACLSGVQARLGEIFGFACGSLLVLTLLLVGFAPVAWLFAQSTQSLAWMGALHLVFWFIASLFGLRFLRAGFIHSQARHQFGLGTWMAIFLLVMLQMTTTLRPLIGKNDSLLPREKKFFLTHWGDVLNNPEARQ
jgi:hypothetical protein